MHASIFCVIARPPFSLRLHFGLAPQFAQIVLTSSAHTSVPSLQFRSLFAPLTHVVDFAGAGVDRLEQLIDLIVGHLLAKIGKDVAQLADADEARHIFVKDLKAAAVVGRVVELAEAARPVQDP